MPIVVDTLFIIVTSTPSAIQIVPPCIVKPPNVLSCVKHITSPTFTVKVVLSPPVGFVMVHPSHPVWAKDFSTKKSDITTTNIIFKTLIFNFILRLFLSIVDAITNQSLQRYIKFIPIITFNLTWQWQFKSIAAKLWGR